MGGTSSEHEVSLKSGGKVADNLDPYRFRVTTIRIQRSGLWEPADGAPMEAHEAIGYLKERNVDCVFIALHGPGGEDGRIQGLLDTCNIAYTGSGCAASALAMDKIHAKAIMRDARLPVAADLVVRRADWVHNRDAVVRFIIEDLGVPCVVKCPTQGSSLGMAIPRDEDELRAALSKLSEMAPEMLIEQYLKGTEVTCGVLDTDPEQPPRALPLTEIAPVSAAFFDYTAKYTPGATEEITPARVDEKTTETVQEIALRAHQLMGCSGLSRSDFIICDGEPYWLEVNTIPGFTETSLFPQAAAAAGIPYGALVGLLVDAAMARHEARQQSLPVQ
jgi:D-alanine-D-alanine ligase